MPDDKHSALVDYISKKHYQGKYKDKLAEKMLSDPETFNGMLEEIRVDHYSDINKEDFYNTYYNKHGNPFKKKSSPTSSSDQKIPIPGAVTAPNHVDKGSYQEFSPQSSGSGKELVLNPDLNAQVPTAQDATESSKRPLMPHEIAARNTELSTQQQLNKELADELDNGIGEITSKMSSFSQGVVNNLAQIPKGIAVLSQQMDRKLPWVKGDDKKKIEEYATYKAAKKIEEWANEMFPTNPKYQRDFSTALMQGMGSLTAIALSGLGKKAVDGGLALTTQSLLKESAKEFIDNAPSLVTGGFMMGGSEFDNAKNAGKSDDEAFDVWLKNFAIGHTDAIPLALWAKRLNNVTKGGVTKILANGFKGGFEEGTQEVVQNYLTNLTAKGAYDKTRDLTEGMLTEGGAGFVLGFLIPGIGSAIQQSNISSKEKQGINNYLNEISSLANEQLGSQEETQLNEADNGSANINTVPQDNNVGAGERQDANNGNVVSDTIIEPTDGSQLEPEGGEKVVDQSQPSNETPVVKNNDIKKTVSEEKKPPKKEVNRTPKATQEPDTNNNTNASEKIISKGKEIISRANEIKQKWHTKDGKWKKNAPDKILIEAKSLSNQFNELDDQYKNDIGHSLMDDIRVKKTNESKITLDEKPEKYTNTVSEELPLNVKVSSDFKESDLDNTITLRNIGKNLINDLNLKEDQHIRKGLIKRFTNKALGLFFSKSGIVRVNNMNDIKVLSHELGHWMDFEVFGIHKGKNSIEHKKELKSELRNMLKSYGYGNINNKEGIAEFISHYIVKPDFVRKSAPNFYNFFENLLDQNPTIQNGLLSARQSYKEFSEQDPRQITESSISREDKDNSFISGIRSFAKNAEMYIYNSLASFRKLDEQLRKTEPSLKNSESPLIQVLSTLGVDGKAKQWLENHPIHRNGEDVEIVKNVNGILKTINPIIQNGTFKSHEGYLVSLRNIELYNRASNAKKSLNRLVELVKVKNKTTNQISELNELKGKIDFLKTESNLNKAATTSLEIAKKTKSLYEKQLGVKHLNKFRSEIDAYNNELLKYYRDSGKISNESYKDIRSLNKAYIPFSRYFDEYEAGNKALTNNMFEKKSSIKRIRGSKREITSPIEAVIQNTYDILSSSDRNIALKTTIDAMNKIDKSLVQKIPSGQVKVVKNINTGEKVFHYVKERPKDKNIISVWENGKEIYYEIPKEYYDGFFAINQKVSSVIKLLSLPSRLLQAGAVVYDPTFAFRNISRDQITAMFYTKHGYNPLDFVRGIISSIGKDDIYQKWMGSGADMSFLTAMDQLLDRDVLEQRVNRKLNTRWKKYRKNPLSYLQDISRASEMGTRVGAFRNAYQKTGDVWASMKESREIGADYGIRGTKLKEASILIPFFNARLQHMRMTYESFKTQPKKVLAKGLLYVTAPSVVNWLFNNLDDDDRELYQSLPGWRKKSMWNIRIPGTDSYLPVPKGFFGTLFGTSVESILDWAVYNDPEAIKGLANALIKEISPGTSFIDFMPQISKPLLEQWANKQSFTGKPIIYNYMEGLSPEEQYTSRTPEVIKELGKLIEVSPRRIETLIQSSTGGAGSGAIIIADEILQLLGIVDRKPEDVFTKLGKLPITKAIVTPSPKGTRSKYVTDFYEAMDELETINKTVNNYIKDEKPEKIEKYLSLDNRKNKYKYYLNNSRNITKYKDVLRYVKSLSMEVMNDPTIKNKREEIGKIEDIITNSALEFRESYINNKPFNPNKKIIELSKEYRQKQRKKMNEIKTNKGRYK